MDKLPPLPYELDVAQGAAMLHRFLRLKSIVFNTPDVKLYVSPSFLQFIKKRLNVAKCKTLSGNQVEGQFRIDAIDIYVDPNSTRPFYVYY